MRNYKVEFEHDFRQRKSVDLTSVVPQYNVPFAIRDYQLNAINHALTQQRALLLSPTASGKSLIIYIIIRYLNLKTLILVPTTSLERSEDMQLIINHIVKEAQKTNRGK